ncbi:MAG: flavin reductase family protein [Anaerolineae bacterium]
MGIDATVLRQVMRRFATGVMVLTVPSGVGMHAVTVNAVTSVSLNPALMLVCIQQQAQSHALVHEAGIFVLNILSAAQIEVGQRFAFDREARSHAQDFVAGYKGETGGLILQESPAFLECRVVAEYPGGDHTIFLGEVVNAGTMEGAAGPLLYYESHFVTMPE